MRRKPGIKYCVPLIPCAVGFEREQEFHFLHQGLFLF